MKKDAPNILGALKEQLQGESNEMSGKMLERDIRYFEMLGAESFSLRLSVLQERCCLQSCKAILTVI